MRQAGQVAGQSSTRRLGDYRVKLNYNDIDLLRYSLHTRAHAQVSCVCGCIRVARGCCLCAVLSASSWAAMFAARVLERGCAEHPAALMGGAGVCIFFPGSDLFLAANLRKWNVLSVGGTPECVPLTGSTWHQAVGGSYQMWLCSSLSLIFQLGLLKFPNLGPRSIRILITIKRIIEL